MGGGLSPRYSPICVVGKLAKKKNKARGTVGLFPLPIVPSALSIFSIRAIFTGIPSGSLCGGKREVVAYESRIAGAVLHAVFEVKMYLNAC